MDDEVVLHLPDDVHKLCRTCMSVTENVMCHDIVLVEYNESTLAGDMFQFCISESIEYEDGLPKSICDECATSLELFYNFKNQCEQTEINLRKILNLPARTKNKKKDDLTKTSSEILNHSENPSGVEIHDNSCTENYIDSQIEVEETENDTVELLFQKLRDCGNTSANSSTLDLDIETKDISSSQIDIISLIEERKEANNANPEIYNVVSLAEERKRIKTESPVLVKEEVFSDEESSNELKCKLCDVVFSSTKDFNRHSQICKNKIVFENILKLENSSIEQLELFDENTELFPYMCTICGSKFKTRQGRAAHMNAHEKPSAANPMPERIYNCDLCNKIFMTEPKLSSHFYKHAAQIKSDTEYILSNDDNNLCCSFCYEVFDSKEKLDDHLKRHTKTEKVQCEICQLEFIGEANLIKHLTTHKIHIIFCKICLKRFDSLIKLKDHVKLHLIESIKHIFKCPICKTEFTDVESLKMHAVQHLSDMFECRKCRKTFHNKVAYNNHEKQHNEPRFLCSLCGKQYFSGVTLACHIRSHNNEKPFVCAHCNKGFSSRATLSVHKRIHSDFKPYVCSYCGYSCRQSGDLNMHIRTHTGDKPYKCTFPNCERKFTTSSQRKEHHRRHTNERNHKCQLCEKTFLESKTLKVHMLVHTGEKPHSCSLCGKRFRRTHHLTTHMKGHKERPSYWTQI